MHEGWWLGGLASSRAKCSALTCGFGLACSLEKKVLPAREERRVVHERARDDDGARPVGVHVRDLCLPLVLNHLQQVPIACVHKTGSL